MIEDKPKHESTGVEKFVKEELELRRSSSFPKK